MKKVTTLQRSMAMLLVLLICLSHTHDLLATAFASAIPETQDTESYTVTLKESKNGKISFTDGEENSQTFYPGDTVTLAAEPEEGYVLDSLKALDAAEENEVLTLDWQNDPVIFTMPEEDLVLCAAFAFQDTSNDDDSQKEELGTDLEEYLADNISSVINKSPETGKKVAAVDVRNLDSSDLQSTGHHVYIKYTEADEGMLKGNKTIDNVWKNVPEAMMAVYAGIAEVYAVSDDNDYYVAFLDAPKFNGTGKLLDAEFANTNNYITGDVDGIQFDKSKGIAYIPKSIYEENGTETAYALEAQLLYAYNFEADSKTPLSVTIENKKKKVEIIAKEQTIKVPSLDVTTTIPLVKKQSADKISLEDITVYINEEEDPFYLTDEGDQATALYDTQTGELTITCSPIATYSLRIVIGDENPVKAASIAFSGAWQYLTGIQDVQAAKSHVSEISELDRLPGTLLTDLDIPNLKASQLYSFETPVNYTYATNIATSQSALCTCIKKSAPYCYMYNYVYANGTTSWAKMVDFLYGDDGEEKATWDSLIKKGQSGNPYLLSSYGSSGQELEDYTFAIRPIHGKCETVNTDVPVTQNFGGASQWGITSGTDPNDEKDSDSSSTIWKRRRLALHCAHSDTELEERDDDDNESTETCYCRILYVDQEPDESGLQYMVVGFVTPKVTTQQGAGVYKIRIKNSKGKMAIKKSSSNTKLVADNDNYSLKGAEFDVLDKDGARVGTLTTDEDGDTPELELPAGTYTVRETKAPKGYKKSDEEKTVTLTAGKTAKVEFKDEPYFGAITILKESANPDITAGNGCYSLANATFTVSRKDTGDIIATVKTGEESEGVSEVTVDDLPLGDYILKETDSSTGFLIAPSVEFSITMENAATKNPISVKQSVPEPELTDPLKITLYKHDESGRSTPQGMATLEGAEFTISYYDAQLTLEQTKTATPLRHWVLQTKKETNPLGETEYVAEFTDTYLVKDKSDDFYRNTSGEIVIPLGTITIQETKAPVGYTLEGAKMSLNGTIEVDVLCQNIKKLGDGLEVTGLNNPTQETITLYEQPIRGGVKIYKRDADTANAVPQGNAALNGARFAIINNNPAFVRVNDKDYAPGQTVYTMVTDDRGYAETTNDLLPYGDYIIREIAAPAGYLDKGITEQALEIRENHVIVDKTDTSNSIHNAVIRGGVKIRKLDGDTKRNTPQGDATLEGAVFEILNRSQKAVVVGGASYAPGQVCAAITTGPDGRASTAADLLPYGHYEIREAADGQPDGYLWNEKNTREFDITENGSIVDLTGDPMEDPVIRGGVEIYKRDLQSGDNHPEGGASLEGAVFSIYNVSGHAVYVDGQLYDPGQETPVMTITTDEKGYAATGIDTLPYGSYIIQETSAPTGYLSEGILEHSFQVRENGALVDLTGKQESIHNLVKRGDLIFRKIDGETQKKMANIPFKLTCLESGESVTIMTDENGQFSTHADYALHSHDTNGGQAGSGTWFGTHADGTLVPVDDTLGALPYGTYELEELACEGNKNKELYKDTFVIRINEYQMSLGNIENHDTHNNDSSPSIGTTAKDAETETHYAAAEEDATIIDTVAYTNLQPGKEYRVSGTLVNRTTGEILKTQDGQPVTAQEVFTPQAANGSVDITFTFDASLLKGQTVVAFEEVYADGLLVCAHCEIDDEGQSVHFPEIGTKAADKENNTNISEPDEDIIIVDTVSYTNLQPGRKYTVTGTLMDKETNEPALDDNGNPITASQSFRAAAENGTVDVTFHFKGISLAGKTLVAFEKVEHNGGLYAVHEDINDESQTIYFPEIRTSAHDKNTGIQLGNGSSDSMAIIDVVSYRNLKAGKGYTMYGQLLNKETGKPVMDADGKEVTATADFVASETGDGTMEMTFTFTPAADFPGTTTVVGETLMEGDVETASHVDLEDAAQTVYIPQIHTTATDEKTGSHHAAAEKDMTVTDTVTYENLIPGKTYTVTGTLMDKETGKELLVAGKKITQTAEFTPETPSGSVEIQFTFDASDLSGHSLVAFEKLYIVGEKTGEEIASHEDINDKDQTVSIKTDDSTDKEKKSNTPGKKTYHAPQTGLQDAYVPACLLAAAAAGAAFLFFKKRGKKK